jgi:hypothetical protein
VLLVLTLVGVVVAWKLYGPVRLLLHDWGNAWERRQLIRQREAIVGGWSPPAGSVVARLKLSLHDMFGTTHTAMGLASDGSISTPPDALSKYLLEFHGTTAIHGWIYPFAHEMRRPDGTRRIVIVLASPDVVHVGGKPMLRISLTAYVLAPTSFHNDPRLLSSTLFMASPVALDAGPDRFASVLAGQRDAKDPSMLSIELETPEGNQQLIGMLQNDDTVEWRYP